MAAKTKHASLLNAPAFTYAYSSRITYRAQTLVNQWLGTNPVLTYNPQMLLIQAPPAKRIPKTCLPRGLSPSLNQVTVVTGVPIKLSRLNQCIRTTPYLLKL